MYSTVIIKSTYKQCASWKIVLVDMGKEKEIKTIY